MSSAADTPAPPDRPNPFARIAGLVGNPAETMRDVAQRPDWVVPLILILLVSVGLNFIAVPRVDMETQLRDQLTEQGNLSAQQIEEMVERVAAFQKFAMPITAISVILTLIALAALYLLITKVFGGEGTYKQYLSVTTYAWMPQLIKAILVVVLLVRAGTVTPDEMGTLLKSNLGFLADPEEQGMLFAFLSSIDLFNLATLALMAIGYGWASRMGVRRGAIMVGVTYAVWILVRIGIAAMRP